MEQAMSERRVRCLIRTDGTITHLAEPVSFEKIHQLIGADMCDTVALRHMGEPLHVMLLDDNGYETKAIEHDGYVEVRPIRALKPINEEATRLYLLNCLPGTTHQIVGDVVIVPDEDYAP
jgi:hypothetical protein